MRSTANHSVATHQRRRARVRFGRVFAGVTVVSFALLPSALGGGSPVAADFGDAPDGHNAGYPPCQSQVCEQAPHCCDVEWDALCAKLAQQCDVCVP